MGETDKKKFAQLLVTTAELFEKDLSSPVINMYFTALKRFPIDHIQEALGKVVALCKFFPKPVEIIELVGSEGGKLEDIAQIQADIVVKAIRQIGAYQTVQFNDQITTVVISNTFGGWIMACLELIEKNEKWFKKDFIKSYQSYHRQNIKSCEKLIGIIEAQNTTRGLTSYIPKPILVEGVEVLRIE